MDVNQKRLPFSDNVKVKIKIKLKRKKWLSRKDQEDIIQFLKKYEN